MRYENVYGPPNPPDIFKFRPEGLLQESEDVKARNPAIAAEIEGTIQRIADIIPHTFDFSTGILALPVTDGLHIQIDRQGSISLVNPALGQESYYPITETEHGIIAMGALEAFVTQEQSSY